MTGEQPPQRRPRRRPGENREHLLEAGIREFGLSGFRGARTAAIAALAEVPQPHVYASFRTKRELFLACAARIADDADSGVLAMRADEDAPQFLLQAVAALGDEEVGAELRPLLRRIRSTLGERAFDAMLQRAAAALLSR